MHEIAGVHHVAIGIKNKDAMNLFYKELLGFNDVLQLLPDTSESPHIAWLDLKFIIYSYIDYYNIQVN